MLRKRIIPVTAMLLFSTSLYAQNWIASGSNLITNGANNVGVNTATTPPVDRLTVNDGDLSMTSSNPSAFKSINARTDRGGLNITVNATSGTNNTGPFIQMYGASNGWRQGGIWYNSWAQNTAPAWGNAHIFQNYNIAKGTWATLMALRDEDGYTKVTIGDVPSAPTGYSLFVQHGILTERVRVALTNSTNWADYVFDKKYKLKPLEEVESYINENKHLPGVPSGDAIVNEGGIDMNQMFSKQMEKIEELTLYIIQQQKNIIQQQKEIDELKSKLRDK
ncbi:hypothetical protein ACTHGU_16200 [Chitinophagaceae bacterium MMS25-I14]